MELRPTQKRKIDYWFATLTIISGLLHLVIVSLMHRENFIELWFFTFAGAVQLGFGIYSLVHRSKAVAITSILIIVHGALLTLWLFTRVLNAPFATYPEALGQFDGIIALLELIAVVVGARILSRLRVSRWSIVALILVSIVVGGLNYAGAKLSEKVFRSIPISTQKHGHGLGAMFVAPSTNPSNTSNSMSEMMDDNSDQVPILGSDESMREMIPIPAGHDNSDGHHDS